VGARGAWRRGARSLAPAGSQRGRVRPQGRRDGLGERDHMQTVQRTFGGRPEGAAIRVGEW
jgi:hypothetical protein